MHEVIWIVATVAFLVVGAAFAISSARILGRDDDSRSVRVGDRPATRSGGQRVGDH